MRWRPEEDNKEQDERLDPDLAGRRHPANDLGKGTSSAADDDILGRSPLEPRCIDNHVEENCERKQRRRCNIGQQSKYRGCR